MNTLQICVQTMEVIDNVTTGQRAAALRIERGVSQSELADRLKISKGQLCRLEAGQRTWTVDFLQRYETALESKP
jgi:transcriptional regulator with XRE-family HTH domain